MKIGPLAAGDVHNMIDELRTGWFSLPRRPYPVALAGAAAAALAIGIPTDVVPSPWFTRMTPVRPEDCVFLVLTALLTGLLLATYLGPGKRTGTGAAIGGGALSVLAVGCPVCNKLVVALLGFSGALTFFAPLQPVIGAAAVGLAAAALVVRLRRLGRACSAELRHRPVGASPPA
jgi:hypothetical protein